MLLIKSEFITVLHSPHLLICDLARQNEQEVAFTGADIKALLYS